MKNTLTSLRLMAAGRLMQYRKYRNFLQEQRINLRAANAPAGRGALHAERPNAPNMREITQIRGWVRAIDRVREKLAAESPRRRRFMDRCFCLDASSTAPRSSRARIIELCMDLHISESTAYKWRENILDLVLFAAIEAGVLTPFAKNAEKESSSSKA